MKLRDLKYRFRTRFYFAVDAIDNLSVNEYYIVEDPNNEEKITMMDASMRGGFISFDDESSIWDDEVIVFNS